MLVLTVVPAYLYPLIRARRRGTPGTGAPRHPRLAHRPDEPRRSFEQRTGTAGGIALQAGPGADLLRSGPFRGGKRCGRPCGRRPAAPGRAWRASCANACAARMCARASAGTSSLVLLRRCCAGAGHADRHPHRRSASTTTGWSGTGEQYSVDASIGVASSLSIEDAPSCRAAGRCRLLRWPRTPGRNTIHVLDTAARLKVDTGPNCVRCTAEGLSYSCWGAYRSVREHPPRGQTTGADAEHRQGRGAQFACLSDDSVRSVCGAVPGPRRSTACVRLCWRRAWASSRSSRVANASTTVEQLRASRRRPPRTWRRQIPGFSVTNVSNDRGLGEASQNVLINGQRITGKGNDARDRAAAYPGDGRCSGWRSWTAPCSTSVASRAMYCNVITEQGSVTGDYLWRPQFRQTRGQPPAGRRSQCLGQDRHRGFHRGPALGWFPRRWLGRGDSSTDRQHR